MSSGQPTPESLPGETPLTGAKLALRDQLLTARGRLSVAEIGAGARALAAHLLKEPEIRRAATVAAYVSVGTEPGTGPLLEALLDSGTRIILPLLQPDNDLDWAVYDPSSTSGQGLTKARRGLLEPAGIPLGRDAIAGADVVLVPGLAVDERGYRMGRGGGSYDRALGRVPLGTFTCVLLYDAELAQPVPVEPHDRWVTAAATPSGVRRLR